MSFEFNDAIRNDIMCIVHRCNSVSFLMGARIYKVLLLSMPIIEGGVTIFTFIYMPFVLLTFILKYYALLKIHNNVNRDQRP